MCNSQWLPREVKLGDALLGDHQQHRKHRPPQSETYISERKKCLFDEFHAQATMEGKKTPKTFQHKPCSNEIPSHRDSLKGRGIFNNDKADQLLQSTKTEQWVNCCRMQTYQTLHNFIRNFVEINLVINIYGGNINRCVAEYNLNAIERL